MKTIGVNLLWLESGVVGGSEEYTLGALRAVSEIAPPDLDLRLFGPRSLPVHHPDLSRRFDVVTVPRMPAGKLGRIASEHTWLARRVGHLALVHHAGGVIPVGRPTRSVLTIHDLQPLDLPPNFGFAKRRWLRWMIPRSAHKARLIVVPSEFTAARVTELLGVPSEKIRVVPWGIEPSAISAPLQFAVIRDSDRPVFLYPAIAYAHKRHIDLIDAFAEVHRRDPECRLVLTGRSGPLSSVIAHRIDELGLGRAVTVTGRIPRSELTSWFLKASAVVIPSEYEGFGLPALEAMSLGVPVIAADAGSLPEVVGDAGLLVPPRDPDALVAAMRGVLDAARAGELSDRGRRRAGLFSQKRSGEALIAAYRDALG